MKSRFLGVLTAAALAASSAFAANLGTDTAADAVYNDGLQNGDNGGSGFNAWSLAVQGTGGGFIGDAVGQGFGDINDPSGAGGEAWGFFGNPAGANGINADRTFDGGALTVGQTFLIDLAIAFRNGNKGIDLDVGGGSVWNFNVGSDLYTVNGVDLGWTYSQTSVFELSVTATGAGTYDVSLTRGSDVFNQSYANGGTGIDGFGLYVFGTDAGDDRNNLFVNNLAIVPEPSTIVLGLVGALGLVAARRRMQK